MRTSTDRSAVAFVLAACAITFALVAGSTSIAVACGYCHGDKEAAVYDAGVLAKAKREGKRVVYAEVMGVVPDGIESRDTLLRAIASQSAVDKASIRVSSNPAAVSFAFAPNKANVPQLLEAISKKLSTKQWALKLLKTVE